MFQLCTYFDRNYLLQGIALHRSLERQRSPFTLWMLCLDDESYRIVESLRLSNVVLIHVDDLLSATPHLTVARENRPRVEFYYACTAPLVQFVADRSQGDGGVTYLDADMYFFNDLAVLGDEIRDSDVLLVEHRSFDQAVEELHGRYNVSFVHFSGSDESQLCLDWWAQETFKSTALGGGIWGDQRYLDDFPRLFKGVNSVSGGEMGLAPWNLMRHEIFSTDGVVTVDGSPLVAYHFARFMYLSSRAFMPIRRNWVPRSIVQLLYVPYQEALRSAHREVRSVAPGFRPGYTRRNLRGVALGMISGRTFFHALHRPIRLGVYVPSTREEIDFWWGGRRRSQVQ